MGNSATSSMGDTFSCFRKHENQEAVHSGQGRMGLGRDLDEAVLAATNRGLEANGGLINIISLTFKGHNFPNLDTFTRTDGIVVLYKKSGNFWQKLGRTEVIMDNLNPEWVTSLEVTYQFEKREYYKVEVYDVEDFNVPDNLDKHDYVGSLEFALHEVVTARDQTLCKDLICSERPAGQSGKISITADERSGANNEEMSHRISADLSDTSGMNFFLVYKFISPQVYKPVYKSEIMASLNGIFLWKPSSILTSELCNEDPEREIKIEFFKSQKSGLNKNLGNVTLNLGQLKEGTFDFNLRRNNKNTKDTVKFESCDFSVRHSFLEYIFGGCQIQLAVSVDFTLSNGHPSERDSLHYLDMTKNEYLQAIRQVGGIVQYYDSDKQFPVYGFGAEVPPALNGRASHCFALNGDIFNPEVDGLEGIVDAYKNALKNVNLYGPTNFAPIVELIGDMAEDEEVSQENQKYFILLIITDGIINDMQKTIDQIVRCANLPISIIIVGVGNEDFESMDILDADDEPLYSMKYKKYMDADIVQFVPFRDFKNNPTMLAKETLDEVPRQLLDYMRKNHITPNRATAEQKRLIQQKLAAATKLGGQEEDGDNDEFFSKRKATMIQKMGEMGMNEAQVADFIENKCMFEENPELIIDNMDNPRYINSLRVKYKQEENKQQSVNFVYDYDPVPGSKKGQNQQFSNAPQSQPPLLIGQQQQQQQYRAPQMKQPTQFWGNIPKQLDANENLCKLCFTTQINTVMVPCGHRCICDTCKPILEQNAKSNRQKVLCPICRDEVQQIIKTYAS